MTSAEAPKSPVKTASAPAPVGSPKIKVASPVLKSASRPKTQRFDVFSDAPLEASRETMDYEMRRLWDAWSEQMAWMRTPAQVEQAFGVSRKVLIDFYAARIYPQRAELLQLLTTSAAKKGEQGQLAGTPRAGAGRGSGWVPRRAA